VARYRQWQEISKFITIVSPVMAQQTPLPKDDEAAQAQAAVDSADGGTAAVLQQEHESAVRSKTELV